MLGMSDYISWLTLGHANIWINVFNQTVEKPGTPAVMRKIKLSGKIELPYHQNKTDPSSRMSMSHTLDISDDIFSQS